MAKTSYIDLSPEMESLYFAGVESSDRFNFSRIIKKKSFVSFKKKSFLFDRSFLPAIGSLWLGLSDGQRENWNSAGNVMGLSGYHLFVQDQSARMKKELSGIAIPSLYHQSFVGNLSVKDPASEIKIIQKHPHFYWVSQKVVGKKSMREPVLVEEDLALPVKISLNYSSDLSAINGESFAKFFALFWHSYKGEDLFTELVIPLDFSCDWKHSEAILTDIIGYVVSYNLFFHLKGVRGELYFDDIEVYHSEQNWARDQFCENINKSFSGGFSRVLKNWDIVSVPVGASYQSIYKDF